MWRLRGRASPPRPSATRLAARHGRARQRRDGLADVVLRDVLQLVRRARELARVPEQPRPRGVVHVVAHVLGHAHDEHVAELVRALQR